MTFDQHGMCCCILEVFIWEHEVPVRVADCALRITFGKPMSTWV